MQEMLVNKCPFTITQKLSDILQKQSIPKELFESPFTPVTGG